MNTLAKFKASIGIRVSVIGLLILSGCGSGASPQSSSSTPTPTQKPISYQVNLTWNAPSSSPDPIIGYNVYRTLAGSNNYSMINTTVDTATTYVDKSVTNGTTYDYIVESVDGSDVESAPSNMAAVTIPSGSDLSVHSAGHGIRVMPREPD